MTILVMQPDFESKGWTPAPGTQALLGRQGGVSPRRDARVKAPKKGAISLESSFLQDWPPRDQFGRGTCVAFAVAGMLELHRAIREDIAPMRMSEQTLYAAMRDLGRPEELTQADWDAGATLLKQAKEVLSNPPADGNGRDWGAPYRPVAPGRPRIGNARDAVGAPPRPQVPLVHGWIVRADEEPERDNDVCATGGRLAQRLVALLEARCPVAAGFPALPHDSGFTNWTLPSARRRGLILCPEDEGAPPFGAPSMAAGGHVVCITGFRPDKEEPSGGWFVFRNSWGLDFASEAAATTGALAPPGRGYGLLSATHVDRYCWEYLAPAPSEKG